MSDSTLGILACLFTVCCWTIGTYTFTVAARKVGPSALNRVRLLYALIVLTVVTCAVDSLNPLELLLQPDPMQLLWFAVSGLVGFTLGDYYGFQSFRILGGRRAVVFVCIAPACALLVSMALLGETLSFIGVLGMVISIAGIMMLSLSRQEKDEVHQEGHGHFVQGVIFALIGAACQGIGLVLSKKGFQVPHSEISALHATWVRLLAATLSAYAIAFFRINVARELHAVTSNWETFKPVIIGTIFGPVLGVTFSLLGVRLIEASVAQTLLSLTPVSVTITSALYYRERIPLVSYFSVVLCIIGVLVLVWRDSF